MSTKEIDPSSLHFRIMVNIRGANSNLNTAAMVDSGATALFLDRGFVQKHSIRTFPLRKPIGIFNIDGTANQGGDIAQFARQCLTVDGQEMWTDFLVTDLGGEEVILGLPWLRKVNPDIDWEGGRLRVRSYSPVTMEEIPDSEGYIQATGPAQGDALLESVLPEAEPAPEPPDPSRPLAPDEPRDPEPEDAPPLCRIKANRATRRVWTRKGILGHTSDEVWIAAGYTYSQQLAEEAHKSKPVRTLEEMVPEEYRQYAKVFSEAESERLPAHKPWDHAIDLTPGAPASMRTKIYPMSINEQEELDEFLKENLRKGYIRPSKSPIASPVFFIKKKDGKLRFVQDYRRLNEITVKNRYPLPLVADIVSRLKDATYFTKFDVRWGYNNVRIKEGDEWKAAFATNRGLFEPKVMFFGLTNSPATFQALMNSIFADLIAAGQVAVYLDDILIFSNDLEEHRQVVKEVLARLRKNDLYLRPEKCEFEKREIEYLGLVIRKGQVEMDPVKVAAVKNWPAPRNLREVRGFLGFANFYRRFIEKFAELARPLNNLTKKDVQFRWTDIEDEAFNKLRDAFTSAPILTLWDSERPMRMEVDASGYATGGVLKQQLEDGLWHPVAFRSSALQPAERNYEIYDREMLAIVEALKDWRSFLEGLPQPFEIHTDHENLKWWTTAQDLSRRQARWALWLSRFDFRLIHKPGKANTEADALSRLSSHHVSDADDNQQRIVLDRELFTTIAANTPENPLEKEIRDASEREAQVLEGLQVLRKKGLQRLANGLAEWEEEDGLVYHRGRVYVPPNDDLRRKVVQQCHDSPTAGHPGIHGTLALVDSHYWWPTMRDVN